MHSRTPTLGRTLATKPPPSRAHRALLPLATRCTRAAQEFARIADTYGDGTARLTCEENILFVNVRDEVLPAMLAEPVFQRFKVNPGAARLCGWVCMWVCGAAHALSCWCAVARADVVHACARACAHLQLHLQALLCVRLSHAPCSLFTPASPSRPAAATAAAAAACLCWRRQPGARARVVHWLAVLRLWLD